MIKPKPHFLWNLFFDWYISLILRLHFHAVELKGTNERIIGPVLLISNHFSWWDGFIVRHLNKKRLQKIFHVMMLEEQLSSRMFLTRLGAFSVKKGKRSVIESLAFAARLLNDPSNLVVYFPQGRFFSQHVQPIIFEKGLERLIANLEIPVNICYVAMLTDYFANKKPTMNVYYKFLQSSDLIKLQQIESDFNIFYKSCIEQQQP